MSSHNGPRDSSVRGYELDCTHTVWFRKQHAPAPGEHVFCQRCQQYRALPQLDAARATYYPEGDWKAYKVGRVVRGVCAKEECDTELIGPFFRVRSFFEKHERRGCAIEVSAFTINVVDLPPNSPPPF